MPYPVELAARRPNLPDGAGEIVVGNFYKSLVRLRAGYVQGIETTENPEDGTGFARGWLEAV
jgi:hypothetical protein